MAHSFSVVKKGCMRNSLAPAVDTAQRILDIAERLVQTQGFNGFSYADISAELAITKASLHYHFPTKAELGRSLIDRYRERFLAALGDIGESGADARLKLKQYVRLYADVLRRNRMCLCGMLAADFGTLSKPMRESVISFFDASEAWLSTVLEEGRKAKRLRFEGSAEEAARLLVASLEGAMLVARSYGDVARFESAADRLLGELGAGARRGR
jgi:TetR/AcrR family transcriptional repressor of nem operon